MDVLDIACIILLLSLLFTTIYSVYSAFNPQLVKIDNQYYIRKWSLFFWLYLSNSDPFWWSWSYAHKWANHRTLQEATKTFNRSKTPKVQIIKLNKDSNDPKVD